MTEELTSRERSPSVTKRIIAWDEFLERLDLFANLIKCEFGPDVTLIGIPKNGVIIASLLSHRHGFEMDYADRPEDFVFTDNVIIIDDIGDTGLTLSRIRPSVRTAVIYLKPWCKVKPTAKLLDTVDWIFWPWECPDE